MSTKIPNGNKQTIHTFATLEVAGDRLVIPFSGNESLDHWILKLMATRMLLEQGYAPSEFELEKSISIGGESRRADVFAKKGNAPVWVECRDCPVEKLTLITQNFQGRVIHIDDFWWASLEEIEAQAKSEYEFIYSWVADGSTHEPVSFVPGVESWQCDLRSTPNWGVIASEDGTLVFLEHRNPDERPIELWSFLWFSHARACGRSTYRVETIDNRVLVPPPRFLINNWQPDYSPQTMNILERHGRKADETPLVSHGRDAPKLGYLVELLLCWGFPAEGISIRRKTRVGRRNFIPYILGQGADISVWIERTFVNEEKLRYIRDHFDGRIMVLPDQREWSIFGCSPIWLTAGVEYWHTWQGILTGWGIRRSRDNCLHIFRTHDNIRIPCFSLDLLMGREASTDWHPPVKRYGEYH